MNPAYNLFGTYQPLTTPIHRCPLWLKGLTLVALGLLLAFTTHWMYGTASLVTVLALGTLAQIPPTTWVKTFISLAWLILILAIYYTLARKIQAGADVLLTLLTMICASKVLLWSTPMPAIIDGFARLCGPLRWLGISPDRIGLALALMIRSIPAIMDRWLLINQAVTARGLKVSPFRLMIPLVISTVSYAQDTGDALAARGLDAP
ncbi:energy-coupling factor transporter transmembrane component T family protein [Rothia nasimurium]|uniref:energy-coupling factor transporter transmembrane component T family protein n=1 Tax=Rothia nasimurium TaxID=85336 RepID=UPI003B9F3EE0